jgi:hypothetical protein
VKKIIIKLIEIYQNYISPFVAYKCKFYPSCSEYLKQAVIKKGIFLGTILGIFRVLKCNPFSKGGIDFIK